MPDTFIQPSPRIASIPEVAHSLIRSALDGIAKRQLEE
jgi:hypothetical protein